MKPINELTKEDLKDIGLIIFDVDGVLVRRGTKIEQNGSNTILETKTIAKKQIEQIKKLHDMGYSINISSGRGLYMLQNMFRDVLEYISLTYENGSCTWIEGINMQHFNSFIYTKGIMKELTDIINNDSRVKGVEPKEYIITIHCKERVKEIEHIIKKYNALATVWNGEAYDILVDKEQNKGVGVKHVGDLFGLKRNHILAIGDNHNDKELLDAVGIAVTADKSVLKGDYWIAIDDKRLPADILMEQIIGEME